MGGEEAVTGLLFPPLSSDSPALRRGEEVRNSRRFECFVSPGLEPPFFYFFFSSVAVAPSVPPAFPPHFLNSEKSFGSALRGFDAEEGKHPIASRAGKFG